MEDLIEIVRQYKVIYDTKCKEYRDQSIRASVWEEIGEKIKQPPEKCKDDWNKLRNCYVNALKRRKNKKSGQAAQFVPPWKYEEQMSFLQPYMESRSTTTNLSSPPESPEFHSDSTQSDNSRPATPHTGSSSHSRQPVRKPNLQDLYDMMKSSHDLRIHKHNSKQQQDNIMDETDLFFLSMSKAVKKLPKLDGTKIKLDLHTAVSQAEIRKLQTQAQILRTPINVTHQIVSRPQQPLPLQLHIQPSTSMTTFPAVSATPATSTLDNNNSQQSASTLYNFDSRPQQPLPLQLHIQPSTSMTTFPAVSATPATSTLDNNNSQQSASTLYNFEEDNISSYYSNADFSDDN